MYKQSDKVQHVSFDYSSVDLAGVESYAKRERLRRGKQCLNLMPMIRLGMGYLYANMSYSVQQHKPTNLLLPKLDFLGANGHRDGDQGV